MEEAPPESPPSSPPESPPSSPPPPPQPKDTRRYPRFEMYASVELHAANETMLLPARNISLGGAYLTSDGHDLGMFEVGMELEVVVFDALDEKRKSVRLTGEIVRHDADGLALMWTDSDPDVALGLAKLLNRLQAKESEKKRKKADEER